MDKIKDFFGTKAGKIVAIVGSGAIALGLVGVIWFVVLERGDDRPSLVEPPTGDPIDTDNPSDLIDPPVYETDPFVRLALLGNVVVDPVAGVDILTFVVNDDGTVTFTYLPTGETVPSSSITVADDGWRTMTLPGEAGIVMIPPIDTETGGDDPDPVDPNNPPPPGEVFNPRTNYTITLNGGNTNVDNIPRDANDNRVVRVEDNEDGSISVRIRAAGRFTITGTLGNGEVVVGHNQDDISIGAVHITLSGASITNNAGPAIRAIRTVESVTINVSGTNTLIDRRPARPNEDDFEDNPEDFPNSRNATIFTREVPLTITGSGTLNITAGFAHGIHARGDTVTITGTRVNVRQAHANGIRARRSIVISGATIDITSGNKGIRAGGSQHGNIVIRDNSNVTIKSAGDAIHAEVNVTVLNSTINVTSGGGWQNGNLPITESRTGIRATGNVSITGGEVTVNAARDGFNTSGTVVINGTTVRVSAHRRGIRGQRGVTLGNTDTRIEMSRVSVHGGALGGISHIRFQGGSVHMRFTETAFNQGLPGDQFPDPATYTFEKL